MKHFLFMLVTCACIGATAQTITVRDISNREAVQNAIIKDKNNTSVATNEKGKADISTLDKSDSLTLSHIGYKTIRQMVTGDVDVDLTSKMVELDEVVFSANRAPEKKSEVPYQIEVISKKEIEFNNQPTTAELLQSTGQVFIQKSQQGGGSPVLRGFEANRILLVVDGIRMNNAVYRAGHLQDIITIDQQMLDKTEVLFGPSSTVYGSDALGGVVHMFTKNAEFSSSDKLNVKVNTMARYASAAMEKTGHIDFNIGGKRIASMTNVTYSDFDDLTSGNARLAGFDTLFKRNFYVDRIAGRDTVLRNSDWRVQKYSGYSQIDIMERLNFKQSDKVTHGLNFQYSKSSDIPRYDRLTDRKSGKLRYAQWYYGPQERLLAAYHLNIGTKTAISDNISITAAYQKLQASRNQRDFNVPYLLSQTDDVSVISFNADVQKAISESMNIKYGIEFNYNDVASTAQQKNIVVDTIGKYKTRYPDGKNNMINAAAYISHSWEIAKNIHLADGLRFTYTSLEANFVDTTFFRLPFKSIEQNNTALTGNLGFIFNTDDGWKLSVFASSGFRAPNLDDVSKVFETPAKTVTVPNPELKPEYAYNLEFGLVKTIANRFKFEFNGYYTTLENAIVLSDATYKGADTALYNGTYQKVKSMQNYDHGYIYGFSGGLIFDINDNLSFKTVANYTYGRYTDVKKDMVTPLDHIPPFFGQTDIIYQLKRFDANFFVRYNGAKKIADYRLGTEDNEVYAPAGGMPTWFTINLRLGFNITNTLRLNAACENITDNHYRYFASGISAPGRNFIVSLRLKV